MEDLQIEVPIDESKVEDISDSPNEKAPEPKINIENDAKNDKKNKKEPKKKGGNENSFFAKNKIFLIIIFVLVMLVVICVLVCYFMHKRSAATIEYKNTEFNNLQTTYDKMNKNYKEMQGKITQLHSENAKLRDELEATVNANIGFDKRKEKTNLQQNIIKNQLKEGADNEFSRRATAQSNYENHREEIDEAIELTPKKHKRVPKVEQVDEDEIENINMLVE